MAILADTLEAVIAAVFFDGGYLAANDFIVRIFAKELKKATPEGSLDYKTLLQETLQADRLSAPSYSLIKTEGIDCVVVDGTSTNDEHGVAIAAHDGKHEEIYKEIGRVQNTGYEYAIAGRYRTDL